MLDENLLRQVREQAQARIDAGQEPPWAWYQYMKLVETCDAILASMRSTKLLGEDDAPTLPM